MKVKIGAIEIADVSLDDLAELVKRFGNVSLQSADESAGGDPPPQGGNHKGSTSGGRGTTAEGVILRKLVESGSQGVPTSDLGEMLGRRGKATRGAARQWALRMGIVSDPDIDPFEETRVGTQRAIRIKASLMDIAKAHLAK